MSARNASPARKARDRNFSPAPIHGKLAYLRGHLGPARRRDPAVLARLERERADVGSHR